MAMFSYQKIDYLILIFWIRESNLVQRERRDEFNRFYKCKKTNCSLLLLWLNISRYNIILLYNIIHFKKFQNYNYFISIPNCTSKQISSISVKCLNVMLITNVVSGLLQLRGFDRLKVDFRIKQFHKWFDSRKYLGSRKLSQLSLFLSGFLNHVFPSFNQSITTFR